MNMRIMDIVVNYKFYDNQKEVTLVLLHGWGQNIEMMEPIGKPFLDKYNVLIIDLPGFGKSSEPPVAWGINEYALFVNKVIQKLKIKDIILIGHSFGGRIALVYASEYKVKKLVCLASPYCKELTKLPLKNRIYKKAKKIKCLRWLARIMQNKVGSTDYKNASETMRGVLVKAVNTNLSDYAKKIDAPTLIIWGSMDEAVPVKRAYELEKLIKDAGVVVYEGATHYAYLERINDVIVVLDNFFSH